MQHSILDKPFIIVISALIGACGGWDLPQADPGPACGPQSCAGCCREGSCLDGNRVDACGLQGVACNTCWDPQECSASGTCAVPCGPQSCDGCCREGRCLDGNKVDACGLQGVACNMCWDPQECSASGTCAVPDESRWVVRILGAEVTATNPDGIEWDTIIATLPDPYAIVNCSDAFGSDAVDVSTSIQQDTLTPNWSLDRDCIWTWKKLRNEGLSISVYDEDIGSDELMCAINGLAIEESTLGTLTVEFPQCASVTSVRIETIPFGG